MDTISLKHPARLVYRQCKKATERMLLVTFPRAYKRRSELSYWATCFKAEQGAFSHAHYESLFTTVYGLTRNDYQGKKVIDIGCGPRGSLEWATMAAERVGLDPLASKYLGLRAKRHEMKYVNASAESIPFPEGYFDIVTCLNALDHVDDLQQSIAEIKRITRAGGFFLLSVEIDHPPSNTEPITISEQDMVQFRPQFTTVSSFKVGTPANHNLHGAVLSRLPPYETGHPGVYVAMMRRG
jgi:2-polyprenyl-3-methyl-5-hydroxy-6-metoxy-1,4-benzoquinol methylase